MRMKECDMIPSIQRVQRFNTLSETSRGHGGCVDSVVVCVLGLRGGKSPCVHFLGFHFPLLFIKLKV